jgi:hypothetical protein
MEQSIRIFSHTLEIIIAALEYCCLWHRRLWSTEKRYHSVGGFIAHGYIFSVKGHYFGSDKWRLVGALD